MFLGPPSLHPKQNLDPLGCFCRRDRPTYWLTDRHTTPPEHRLQYAAFHVFDAAWNCRYATYKALAVLFHTTAALTSSAFICSCLLVPSLQFFVQHLLLGTISLFQPCCCCCCCCRSIFWTLLATSSSRQCVDCQSRMLMRFCSSSLSTEWTLLTKSVSCGNRSANSVRTAMTSRASSLPTRYFQCFISDILLRENWNWNQIIWVQ